MYKLYASLNSKLNGLNSISLIMSNDKDESYIIELKYSDYDYSYYAKEFTTEEINSIIDFLQNCVKKDEKDFKS
jgi:hypothetical protein